MVEQTVAILGIEGMEPSEDDIADPEAIVTGEKTAGEVIQDYLKGLQNNTDMLQMKKPISIFDSNGLSNTHFRDMERPIPFSFGHFCTHFGAKGCYRFIIWLFLHPFLGCKKAISFYFGYFRTPFKTTERPNPTQSKTLSKAVCQKISGRHFFLCPLL